MYILRAKSAIKWITTTTDDECATDVYPKLYLIYLYLNRTVDVSFIILSFYCLVEVQRTDL